MGKHGNTTKKDDFFGKGRRARSTRTIMLLFLAVLVAGSVAAVFHIPRLGIADDPAGDRRTGQSASGHQGAGKRYLYRKPPGRGHADRNRGK